MTDIVRMKFQSARRPDEEGTVALDSNGTLRIEPSDAMFREIARLEQESVEKAGKLSATAAFIGIGLVIAAIGWYAARFGGRLRDRFIEPRSLDTVKADYASDKGVRLILNEKPFGRTELVWEPGEYNADEAERFIDAFNFLRAADYEGS